MYLFCFLGIVSSALGYVRAYLISILCKVSEKTELQSNRPEHISALLVP